MELLLNTDFVQKMAILEVKVHKHMHSVNP